LIGSVFLPHGVTGQCACLSCIDLPQLVDACRDLPPAIKVVIRAIIETVE